jgi:hypothetical protein
MQPSRSILSVYLFGNNNGAKKFDLTVLVTHITTTIWYESGLNGLFAGAAARRRFCGICQPSRVRSSTPLPSLFSLSEDGSRQSIHPPSSHPPVS